MLIDDDGVCLTMLSRGLRKRGFVVSAYRDPREAMRHLAQERPEAVVTDMRMPHVTGLDVVQEVKGRLGDEAPPCLVVSADGDEAMLVEAFRLGAVDYLLKPVSEVELGVKLQRAIKNHPHASGLASIPKAVGPWRLHECIGRGGTACVFRSTRDDSPGETYALKVVWPHLTNNTETMLRFRREIDTLSELDHPHLVRFYESGRQEDCFYYVMSHIAGGTLRDRIRVQGPQTPQEALDMIERIADPLGYLHQRSLVHRDVKPTNIFFEGDELYLGDFGLARRLLDKGITLAEEFIGTPLYLAPEVFRTSEFDQSVDFYALGVCAFEMLLGEAPLQEPDSMRLIGRIMDQGLPRPADLIPNLPAPVSDLLDRMLATDVGVRLGSAAQVIAGVHAARGALG